MKRNRNLGGHYTEVLEFALAFVKAAL